MRLMAGKQRCKDVAKSGVNTQISGVRDLDLEHSVNIVFYPYNYIENIACQNVHMIICYTIVCQNFPNAAFCNYFWKCALHV